MSKYWYAVNLTWHLPLNFSSILAIGINLFPGSSNTDFTRCPPSLHDSESPLLSFHFSDDLIIVMLSFPWIPQVVSPIRTLLETLCCEVPESSPFRSSFKSLSLSSSNVVFGFLSQGMRIFPSIASSSSSSNMTFFFWRSGMAATGPKYWYEKRQTRDYLFQIAL